MIPCRCAALNTLSGAGADDYVRQHLDTVREDAMGRKSLRCPLTDITFVLEQADGVYGGDSQRRLRRTG